MHSSALNLYNFWAVCTANGILIALPFHLSEPKKGIVVVFTGCVDYFLKMFMSVLQATLRSRCLSISCRSLKGNNRFVRLQWIFVVDHLRPLNVYVSVCVCWGSRLCCASWTLSREVTARSASLNGNCLCSFAWRGVMELVRRHSELSIVVAALTAVITQKSPCHRQLVLLHQLF